MEEDDARVHQAAEAAQPSPMDDAFRGSRYSDAQCAKDAAAMPMAFNDDFGGDGEDSPSAYSSSSCRSEPSASTPAGFAQPGNGESASTCPTPGSMLTRSSTDALLRLKPDLLVDPFRKRSTALGYTRSRRWATWRQWDYVHLHGALAACPHPSAPSPLPTARLVEHEPADGSGTTPVPALAADDVVPSSVSAPVHERHIQDRWNEPDNPAENSIADRLRSIMDTRIDRTTRGSGLADAGGTIGKGELRVAADGWVDWDLPAEVAQQVTMVRTDHIPPQEQGICEIAVPEYGEGDVSRIVEVAPRCASRSSGTAMEEEEDEWLAEAALLEFDDALLHHAPLLLDRSNTTLDCTANSDTAYSPREHLVEVHSDAAGRLDLALDIEDGKAVSSPAGRSDVGLPTVIPPRACTAPLEQALQSSEAVRCHQSVDASPLTGQCPTRDADELSDEAILRKTVDGAGWAEAWTARAGTPPSPDSEHSQFVYYFPAPSEGEASPSPRDIHHVRQFEADFPLLSGATRPPDLLAPDRSVAAAGEAGTWASRLARLSETLPPVQPRVPTTAMRTGWDGFDIDEWDARANAERFARRDQWQFSELPTPTSHMWHLAPAGYDLLSSPSSAHPDPAARPLDQSSGATPLPQPHPHPPAQMPSPASLIRAHAESLHRYSTLFVEQANNPWLLTQPEFIARAQALLSAARPTSAQPSQHSGSHGRRRGGARPLDAAGGARSKQSPLRTMTSFEEELAQYGEERPPAYSPPRQADLSKTETTLQSGGRDEHVISVEGTNAAAFDALPPGKASEEVPCRTCGETFANREAYESHAREDLAHKLRAHTGHIESPEILAAHLSDSADLALVAGAPASAQPCLDGEISEYPATSDSQTRQTPSHDVAERPFSPGPPRLERPALPQQSVSVTRPKPKKLDPHSSHCTRCQRHFGNHYRLLVHCQDSIAHPYYCRGCTVDFRTFADLHMHYAAEALCRPPQMAYGLGKGFLQILVEHQGHQLVDSDSRAAAAQEERRLQMKDAAGVLSGITRRWWHPLPITPERTPTPAPLSPASHAQRSPEDLPLSSGTDLSFTSTNTGTAPEPAWMQDSSATSNQARTRKLLAIEAQASATSQSSSLPQPCPILDVERGRHETPCCPICISPLMDASEVLATACGHVYCTRCLLLHFRQTGQLCPKCRTPLTMTMLVPLYMHSQA